MNQIPTARTIGFRRVPAFCAACFIVAAPLSLAACNKEVSSSKSTTTKTTQTPEGTKKTTETTEKKVETEKKNP